MAFPSVVNSALTESTTNQASHSITMPSSIVAGNLLVCFARGSATGDFSQSDGWSVLFAGDASDASSGDRLWIGYKEAAGSDTLTLTSTGTPRVAAITWQIEDWDSVELSAAAGGASTTPEPPSFSPTGGAKDYLWLWVGGWEGEQTSPPSGNPTNYSGPIGASTGTAGGVASNARVAGAWRQNNTATEDPPAWTIDVSDDWTAYLIAVHPVPAGGGVTVTPSPFSLTLTTFAPTVTASDHKVVTPSPFSLTLTTFAPTVTASDHKVVTPDPFSLTLTMFAPTVTAGGSVVVTPDPFSLALTTFAPTVTVSDHKLVVPDPFSLVLTTFAPTVSVSANQVVTPSPFSLVLTTFAPTVTASDHKLVTPAPFSLTLTTFAPTVTIGVPAVRGFVTVDSVLLEQLVIAAALHGGIAVDAALLELLASGHALRGDAVAHAVAVLGGLAVGHE